VIVMPALLLLLHPVHLGRALVDLAHLVRDARVVEDALGGRGLPRIDVRHDPDVRVWEMGNERATTTECLSDAQPILVNRQVRRLSFLPSEKSAIRLGPGFGSKLGRCAEVLGSPVQAGALALIVSLYVNCF
jgi:hypothetical protein